MPDEEEQPIESEEEETEGEDAEGEDAEGEDAEGEEEEEEPPPIPEAPIAAEPVYPPSPISRQYREDRFQPAPEPVTIVFLTGQLKGKTLNLKSADGSFLGLNVEEVSEEQSANWSDSGGGTLVKGQEYKGVAPWSFNMSLTFYSHEHDVSHLSEQMRYLIRIDPDEKEPPKLHVSQGDLVAAPCVCTGVSMKRSEPLPGSKGYRKATADLKFKLLAGQGSPNAFAPPLTSTPLGDELQEQTKAEREQEGATDVAQLVLADCLGPEGQKELEVLLADSGNGLSDPLAIANMSSTTRLQLAFAGMLSTDALNDANNSDRLKQDLAQAMAQAEPGISLQARELGNALLSETQPPPKLPSKAEGIYDELKEDFDIIWEDLEVNKFAGEKKPKVFGDDNFRAADRLNQIASCGLKMRQLGGNQFEHLPPDKKDREQQGKVLQEINLAISNKSDEELQELFGFDTQSQVRVLKNGSPYGSRQAFISHLSQAGANLSGHAAWQRIVKRIQEDEDKG